MNYELYNDDCSNIIDKLDQESVDVIITSPPYWNQKSYSYWPTYNEYIQDVEKWVQKLYRVLKQGRHCFWIIPDKLPYPPKDNGTKERLYMPVYSDTEKIASNAGFVCKYPIVWKKPHGTQKMFGSYPYPPTIIHTPMTERICVWRKPGKPEKRDKKIKDESKFTKEQWVQYGQDLWEINPETKINHPAPFPEEIPKRIMTLWSYKYDVVLDPFMGSGTTGRVAKDMGRQFIGIEQNIDYYNMAQERLSNT